MSDLYDFTKEARAVMRPMGRPMRRPAAASVRAARPAAPARPATPAQAPRAATRPGPAQPTAQPSAQSATQPAQQPAQQPSTSWVTDRFGQVPPTQRGTPSTGEAWNPGESGTRYQGALDPSLIDPSSVQLSPEMGGRAASRPNSATPRANFEAPTGQPAPPANPWLSAAQAKGQAYMQQGQNFMQNYGRTTAGLLGVGALGYGLYRAGNSSNEQSARMQDYLANSHNQMNQPLPSMSVYASYDEFAREKCADFMPPPRVDTFNQTHNAFSGALAQSLAKKLVEEPIDTFHRTLKKRLVDDPKAETSFRTAVEGDPHLKALYEKNPDAMRMSFATMRKFAPSAASAPQAVQSFLLNTAMTNHRIDFATIRLLAETEKFVQNAKGRGTNG